MTIFLPGLGVRKLASAVAVYAFPVSGFPLEIAEFLTGNWKRQTLNR